MYLQLSDSDMFAQNWREGLVESRSIRLVSLTELSLLYDLEDYLMYVDVPLRKVRDVEFKLATSSLQEVFYLALISVVRRRGLATNDRFFEKGKMLSFKELKNVTISGAKKKKHLLDSLYDLMMFVYRRVKTFFANYLDSMVDNKACFLYFVSVFDAVYAMILSAKENKIRGKLHAKALLTTFLKQESGCVIERFMNTLH